jgi:hypothetical protein
MEDSLQFTSLAFDETVTAAEGISEVAIPWFLLLACDGSLLLMVSLTWCLYLLAVDVPAIAADGSWLLLVPFNCC